MKLKNFVLAVILIWTTPVFAQKGRQINGLVRDSAGRALPGAAVKLLADQDSLIMATLTDGRFSFHSVMQNQFSLVVSSLGYQVFKRRYRLAPGGSTAELEPIVLKSDTILLNGVTVSANIIAVKAKEDTVEYNAAAYRVREGAPLEDALKKMPGLEVSRDGSVSAQGKQVTKVQLNGKDYLAGDVKSLTRNLPAELVKNVQVIDDHGDRARFTGIKTGESQKVLNINIRKEKNYGYFDQGSLGGGQDLGARAKDANQKGRFATSTHLFHFRGKRQFSVLADFNNLNNSLFDFKGTRKTPDLFGDKQNGITTARASGLNYRDDWGKSLSLNASYSLVSNSVYTTLSTVRENRSGQLPSIQSSSNSRNDNNLNHRFNFSMEYRPDTLNYFKFTPAFSYRSLRSRETFASRMHAADPEQSVVSDYRGNRDATSLSPDFSASTLFNHRFRKRGRNFSALLNVGTTTDDQYENPVYNYLTGSITAPRDQRIKVLNRTDSTGISFSYLEPLTKRSCLEFNYEYHYAHTTASRLTDMLTGDGEPGRDAGLSNDYQFKFLTSRFGTNYLLSGKKYNFTAGLAAQPSLLKGSPSAFSATAKKAFNLSPVLRYVYNFSELQAVAFNFQGTNLSPAYHQLLPTIDFSNASYPVQGNPELLPEYQNTFQLRYNKFGDGTGRTFFSTLSFTQTENKVVAHIVNYPVNYSADPRLAGTLLTRYRNASGFYNASGYYVIGGAWAKRRYTWFFNGRMAYSNDISYLTDVLDPSGAAQSTQRNAVKNLVLVQGARFRLDIADVADAEVNTNYQLSHSGNPVKNASLNSNFQTITFGTNGKFYCFKDWTLSYTYSKTVYLGFQDATNPNLLDTYLEYRFLKKNMAAVRFSACDLFNENTGFTAIQNAFAITQTNVNRLGRYYLLSLSLKLQQWAGKAPRGAPGQERNGG